MTLNMKRVASDCENETKCPDVGKDEGDRFVGTNDHGEAHDVVGRTLKCKKKE